MAIHRQTRGDAWLDAPVPVQSRHVLQQAPRCVWLPARLGSTLCGDTGTGSVSEIYHRVSGLPRSARAVAKGETQGFMKVLVDADSDAILGPAIIGVGGDEAIHPILDTMAAERMAGAPQRTMDIHPTVSELIPTVLGELPP